MIGGVVEEYLDRFSIDYTESVYNLKTIQDYNYMRKCYDYLECDRKAFHQSRTLPAGLRNIGNTCYLNSILQLLFHVNYLREKISSADNLPSKLLQKLQFLFGVLSVGKLPFADPTQVFDQLRNCYPDVFAPGVQNDFHEVFTLLVDSISESYKSTSLEDARFIKKLLMGKMVTRIDYHEGKFNKNADFNIINLDASQGSFEQAFDKWKRYQISDFTTPNGKNVTASAQNIFLETPALMVFFINRVSFRNGKLQKNCTPFEFQESILVSKAFQSEKTMMVKGLTSEKQKQINSQKTVLSDWLKKAEDQVQHIQLTLNYLKAKEAPLLTQPLVQNPMGEDARLKAVQFLQEEKVTIQKRKQNVQKELKELDQKLHKLETQQNCQRYVLWGAMVHQGTSATFGHYKLCLMLGEDWHEFNDKSVSKIDSAAIEGYKVRGQICCLFYRRPLLLCNNNKIAVPFPLKNSVSMFEKDFKRDIDKARILQMLYQETQSLPLLLQIEMKTSSEDKYQLPFKPIHFALKQKFHPEICKGIILQEHIRSEIFLGVLQDKLISSLEMADLPLKTFGIPRSFFLIREALYSFLRKELTVVRVGEAYEDLSRAKLSIKNETCQKVLNEIVEAIILKGLYYVKVFSEYNCADYGSLLQDLNSGLDRLLASKGECEFSFVCIAIKASIPLSRGVKKLMISAPNGQIQDYYEYFWEHFKFWLNQRKQFQNIDETNFFKGSPPFTRNKEISAQISNL